MPAEVAHNPTPAHDDSSGVQGRRRVVSQADTNTMTRIFSDLASERISETTRAWLVREGSAPSRIRPLLGHPVSPINISLPGKVTAILWWIALTWEAAYLARIGKSSQ